MKNEYFESLKALSKKIDKLKGIESDRDKMNKILYDVEEIVGVLNRQRSIYPNKRKELILDQNELQRLKSLVKEIWEKAEAINLVPRTEPIVDMKDLPD